MKIKVFSVSFISFLMISSAMFSTAYTVDQMPEPPQFDDETYLGYEYGSAGIAIALMEAYSLVNMDNTTRTQILDITTNSLEKLWETRVEFGGIQYPTWTKTIEDQFLGIYPGLKYGAPGIIKAFLKIFEITEDPKWLDRAEGAYWYLSTQAINESSLPHWPYHFSMPKEDSGVAITDLKYGSAGVLSLALQLFNVTQNQSYIDHGKLIVSWLKTIVMEYVNDDQTYNILPWYSIDGSTNENLPFYTTYGYGMAGIAPQLYQLGVDAQSAQDKNWAMELGRFLVEIQNEDGSWFSVSDSPSVMNVGFDNGVAGILDGLAELKRRANSTEFDNAISRGINWLFSRYFLNSTDAGFNSYEASKSAVKIKNSLYDGNIGILRTLTKLLPFLTADQITILVYTYKWLITSGSFVISNSGDELLFLLESPRNYLYVDFSYAQGLAGFLSELVILAMVNAISTEINFNFTRAIVAAINTFDFFQQTNGQWQRQYAIPSGWERRHFSISNFSDDAIPIEIILSEFDNDFSTNNTSRPNDPIEYLYYAFPLILILPVIYAIKRRKIIQR